MEPKKIAVVGLWHQGVVAAACLAEMGHDVLGADPDAERVRALQAGRAPLFEPGLDDLLRQGLASGRLAFTTGVGESVRGRAAVLLTFDTPVDDQDRSDLAGFWAAADALAAHLADGAVVLVTAQVSVGTCDALRERLAARRPGLDCAVAYSPENLRLGQALERFRHPPLPVLGGDSPAAFERLAPVLAPLGAAWKQTSLRTAEMVKHALNAFLATSVCFANELGNLCDAVGADGYVVAEMLRLEPRIGPRALLFPGLGFAGGTLARDVQTLRGLGDRLGLETLLLDGAWEANRRQNRLVARKLRQALGGLAGRKVAVLGLTYKPDTSTLRRSPALEIIADLVREGATVRAHDPRADRDEVARQRDLVFHEDPYAAAAGAEAVVLVTGWAEYARLDWARLRAVMARPLLLDTQNMLDAAQLTAAGFTYLDVGRGRNAGGAT